MKKRIGYIFWERNKNKDKKAFEKAAKKKGVELIFFNLTEYLNEQEVEKKAKQCDIIFNNCAEEFAIEFVKTLEELGKKVIDSSETFYYTEDKWIFYLKCKEHKIPTPNTILLSEDINLAKKELENFNQWPVILKRVRGCSGDYVEKADNIKEAIQIINKFWKKGSERIPVIAQEFINSPSYRITSIGDKIVQTAIKEGTGWKKTGVYIHHVNKLKIDKNLKKLVKKIIKIMKINVCGIDLLKKNNELCVIEVNSCPGMGFFENAREKLAEEILKLLLKKTNKKLNK